MKFGFDAFDFDGVASGTFNVWRTKDGVLDDESAIAPELDAARGDWAAEDALGLRKNDPARDK